MLEDLLYSGQEHVPDVLELNVNHMKRIMESLAAMHAASIVHETRTAENLGEKYRPLLFETTVRQDVEWFTTGIKVSFPSDFALFHLFPNLILFLLSAC